MKLDPYISRSHPVMKYRANVEFGCRWSTLEGDEGNPGGSSRQATSTAAAASNRLDIGTHCLLLVGFGNGVSGRPAVVLATLRRVELEGRPRAAVVSAFVDSHWVWSCRTELQTDVGYLTNKITNYDWKWTRTWFSKVNLTTTSVRQSVIIGSGSTCQRCLRYNW